MNPPGQFIGRSTWARRARLAPHNHHIMKITEPSFQSSASNFDRHAILYHQRREALTNGPAGKWYSCMGKISHPDDPQMSRQYYEEKLDEEINVHGHRIFIDGTAMPRVMPEHGDCM